MQPHFDPLCSDYGHEYCIEDALRRARRVCEERGQRFTSLRQAVLELIWSSHNPLGAYELIELLSQREGRRIMPPTIYRTLDFLVELGLVHKISSINAFIGCPFPEKRHNQMFLLCHRCGAAVECSTETLAIPLEALAKVHGFQIETQNIELSGLCPRCQENDSDSSDNVNQP